MKLRVKKFHTQPKWSIEFSEMRKAHDEDSSVHCDELYALGCKHRVGGHFPSNIITLASGPTEPPGDLHFVEAVAQGMRRRANNKAAKKAFPASNLRATRS